MDGRALCCGAFGYSRWPTLNRTLEVVFGSFCLSTKEPYTIILCPSCVIVVVGVGASTIPDASSLFKQVSTMGAQNLACLSGAELTVKA